MRQEYQDRPDVSTQEQAKVKSQDEALRKLAENATPEEAKKLLDSLRWDVDRQITNHEGERVWLGPCLNAKGERIGITDCCLVSDPCEHHAALASKALAAGGGG